MYGTVIVILFWFALLITIGFIGYLIYLYIKKKDTKKGWIGLAIGTFLTVALFWMVPSAGQDFNRHNAEATAKDLNYRYTGSYPSSLEADTGIRDIEDEKGLFVEGYYWVVPDENGEVAKIYTPYLKEDEVYDIFDYVNLGVPDGLQEKMEEDKPLHDEYEGVVNNDYFKVEISREAILQDDNFTITFEFE